MSAPAGPARPPRGRRRAVAFGAAATFVLLAAPAPATTGSGCWVVVNVPPGDVLNLRERRDARSPVVGVLVPNRHGIVSGGWDRADAEARCLPRSRASPSRWCPVTVYDGDRVERGFAKRRFLSPVDCP